MKNLVYILLIFLFSACVNKSNKASRASSSSIDTLNVAYATGFDIYYHENYKQIDIYSPWQKNEILQRLYLVTDPSTETPADGNKITIPLQSIAISSCTHTEFIQLLNEINTVKGVCTPHLIYNSNIRNLYAEGAIISLGDAHNVNIEQLVHLRPDVYLVSSYNQQDEQAKRLQQNGVNIAYNNEWTESSLLARAEWLKFMAAFYDKEGLADSIFAAIEHDYFEASKIAQSVEKRPTVMAGGNFKGTWYMPSGASYMGRMFADAGADYFYANDSSTTTSIALNFETVLTAFYDADVWLNAPTQSLNALMQMDSRHNLFRSAREGNVFGFYARTLSTGANDFWESGVARPDLVLKDIIWALHPNLLTDYQPSYIVKLD